MGFGGRTLSNENQAKYINSPESPVYNKSRELYGLFQAKKEISKKNQVIIVEGYIDVLACYQLGLHNVVAPLGTSLTEQQTNILKRYASEIILMFDGDSAGNKATLKAVETCFTAELHPKITVLPKGSDPGNMLENHSDNNDLQSIVKNASFAMDWIFSHALSNVTAKPAERAKSLKQLISWVNKLPDPFERNEYKKRMSQCFDTLPQEIEKTVEITNKSAILPHAPDSDLSLEAHLLLLFMQNPNQFPENSFENLTKEFEDLRIKSIAQEIQKIIKNNETFEIATAIHALPDELKGFFSRLMFKDGSSDIQNKTSVKKYIQRFDQKVAKKKLKGITAKIMQAELSKNKKLMLSLLKEKQELLKSRF